MKNIEPYIPCIFMGLNIYTFQSPVLLFNDLVINYLNGEKIWISVAFSLGFLASAIGLKLYDWLSNRFSLKHITMSVFFINFVFSFWESIYWI